MEFLSLAEVIEKGKEVRDALNALMANKALVGRPSAAQWKFLSACLEKTLSSGIQPEFDELTPPRAAQLKFEVEDKLRRFYLRPGKPVEYVFSLIHRATLVAQYGSDDFDDYPAVSGYCLVVRDLKSENNIARDRNQVRSYLEKVVSEGVDAEFRAYAALPNVRTEEISEWYVRDGPAYREIVGLLTRHRERGWVISNSLNPSTKRLLGIRVHKIGSSDAVVHTTEYWYLRWWDIKEKSYTYPYRETNQQIYILSRDDVGKWKIYENIRPSPRTSAPHRKARRKERKNGRMDGGSANTG